jgi:hypothetical protein
VDRKYWLVGRAGLDTASVASATARPQRCGRRP